MFFRQVRIFLSIVIVFLGVIGIISNVFSADDPAPIDLQVYIPGVSTPKKECALGKIWEKCEKDEDCNKLVEGKTIKGRCVTKATAVVDPDDKTGGVISYIAGVYRFLVGIAAIASVFMIMIAGYRWLFAGGNSGAIDDAKTRIKGAVAGLVIALLSYNILNLINPELVNLKLENMPDVIETVEQKFADPEDRAREYIAAQCQGASMYLETSNGKHLDEAIAKQKPILQATQTVCGEVYVEVEADDRKQFSEYKLDEKGDYNGCYGRVCYVDKIAEELKNGVTPERFRSITSNPSNIDKNKTCVQLKNATGFGCSKGVAGEYAKARCNVAQGEPSCKAAATEVAGYYLDSRGQEAGKEVDVPACVWLPENYMNTKEFCSATRRIVQCGQDLARIRCDGSDQIGTFDRIDLHLINDGSNKNIMCNNLTVKPDVPGGKVAVDKSFIGEMGDLVYSIFSWIPFAGKLDEAFQLNNIVCSDDAVVPGVEIAWNADFTANTYTYGVCCAKVSGEGSSVS